MAVTDHFEPNRDENRITGQTDSLRQQQWHYPTSLARTGGLNWQTDRYSTGEKRVNCDMNASPEACEWSGIPAQGSILLARLPRRFSFRKRLKPRFLIENRISQWLFRLTAKGLSFPSRLRGSGGLAPLFLASIR
jgi:hypothetical protein